MRRFFVNRADIHGDRVLLAGAEAHHLTVVLRLTEGDQIHLFDGTGASYQARIERITKNSVEARLLATAYPERSQRQIHLGQGLLKGKKMDFVIQKATELGIDCVHPFTSRHCAVKHQAENRHARWQKIVLEACKQCNRPVPPTCLPVTDFDALLAATSSFGTKLVFWEQETRGRLTDFITDNPEKQPLLFLIGPEGGFCETEIARAQNAGFSPVSLGSRTLRAETATIAASAILQYLLGNLGQGA